MKITAALMIGVCGLAGCSKYVPVALEGEKPRAPRECYASKVWERAPKKTVFGAGTSAVQMNVSWAEHNIVRDGVDRRNRRRADVCETFVRRVAKPEG